MEALRSRQEPSDPDSDVPQESCASEVRELWPNLLFPAQECQRAKSELLNESFDVRDQKCKRGDDL